MEFTVLASGSSGNAAHLRVHDFGLLIDVGLGPRKLEDRLAMAELTWADISAVVISHTHNDHWNDRTFARLARHKIPLYCHEEHVIPLEEKSEAFRDLLDAGLVFTYTHEAFRLASDLSCVPIAVPHDSGATFGFRFEGAVDLFNEAPALGYASDLGDWDETIAAGLANVDVLAVEFNHDVKLQANSGRSDHLIERNLGGYGHLSNEQGAALVEAILHASPPGRLQHVVLLHLSRDCNTPKLARAAVARIKRRNNGGFQIHVAGQDEPLPTITIEKNTEPKRLRTRRKRAASG